MVFLATFSSRLRRFLPCPQHCAQVLWTPCNHPARILCSKWASHSIPVLYSVLLLPVPDVVLKLTPRQSQVHRTLSIRYSNHSRSQPASRQDATVDSHPSLNLRGSPRVYGLSTSSPYLVRTRVPSSPTSQLWRRGLNGLNFCKNPNEYNQEPQYPQTCAGGIGACVAPVHERLSTWSDLSSANTQRSIVDAAWTVGTPGAARVTTRLWIILGSSSVHSGWRTEFFLPNNLPCPESGRAR